MHSQKLINTKSKGVFKGKKGKIYLLILIEIIALIILMVNATGVFAAKEYWVIKAGDKTLATMKTQNEAEEAIDLMKDKYVKKGASNVTIKINPVVKVQKQFYAAGQRKPETKNAQEFADYGNSNILDENLDMEITTKQTLDKKEKIKYKTIYKESDQVALNTEVVKKEGKMGIKTTKTEFTNINGKDVDSNILKTSITSKSQDELVLKGTMTKSAIKGDTTTNLGEKYSRESGENLVEFAKKFLGNPYVYGGSSLTKGADCSGFVMALYAHYGIGLPHHAGLDRSYGKGVSLNEAQKGDLICYNGHIGIYAGDNQIIHAMNESHGVTISRIGYNGKKVLTVRRIFG